MTDEQRRIKELGMFFLDNLCDDPQNDTKFDRDVLNALNELDSKYRD